MYSDTILNDGGIQEWFLTPLRPVYWNSVSTTNTYSSLKQFISEREKEKERVGGGEKRTRDRAKKEI